MKSAHLMEHLPLFLRVLRFGSASLTPVAKALLVLTLAIPILISGSVFAAEADEREFEQIVANRGQDLARTLQDKAKQILGREVLDGLFVVIVKAELNAEAIKSTANPSSGVNFQSLPRNLSANEVAKAYLNGMSIDRLRSLAKSIQVKITVDKSASQGQRNIVRSLIENGLSLSSERGEKLVIEDDELQSYSAKARQETADRAVTTLELEKNRLASESQDAKDNAKQIELKSKIEIDRLSSEKSASEISKKQEESKFLKVQSENEDLKKKLSTLEQELSVFQTPLGDTKKLVRGLEVPIVLVGVLLFFLIGISAVMFVYGRVHERKTNKGFESAQLISQALGKIGKNSSTSSNTANSAPLNSMQNTNPQMNMSAAVGRSAERSFLSVSDLESLRTQALGAFEELQTFPYLMASELREWLEEGPEGQLRLAGILVALGPQHVMPMLRDLPPSALKTLDLAQGLTDPASREKAYHSMVGLHFTVLSRAEQLPQSVVRLKFPALTSASDSLLIKAAKQLEREEQSALLSLLPPRRWKGMMEQILEGLDTEEQKQLLSLQIKADPFTKLNAMVSKVGQSLSATERSLEGQGIRLLLGKLESQGDALSASHRELLFDLLREHTPPSLEGVTFDQVLSLDKEILAEVLETLEIEEVASLILSLDDNLAEKVRAQFSGKVLTSLEQDIKRLTRTPTQAKKSKRLGVQVQAKVQQQVQTLVEEGIVSFSSRSNETKPELDPREVSKAS